MVDNFTHFELDTFLQSRVQMLSLMFEIEYAGCFHHDERGGRELGFTAGKIK